MKRFAIKKKKKKKTLSQNNSEKCCSVYPKAQHDILFTFTEEERN